jgi:SAM-dependent methyltransferase
VDHADHVSLLRPGIPISSSTVVWADVGAGDGAFTLALAELLGPDANVIAVDRDRGELESNARRVAAAFPATRLSTLVGDFRGELALPELDGLVAANSLHFVLRREQVAVIRSLAARLKPGGTFLVVEYDADSGNPWVPHPFSSRSWPEIAEAAGLTEPQLLHRVPSRFLGAIYSASAHRRRE